MRVYLLCLLFQLQVLLSCPSYANNSSVIGVVSLWSCESSDFGTVLKTLNSFSSRVINLGSYREPDSFEQLLIDNKITKIFMNTGKCADDLSNIASTVSILTEITKKHKISTMYNGIGSLLTNKDQSINSEHFSFKKVRIVPGSHLAEMTKEILSQDENGWYSSYILIPLESSKTVYTNENGKTLESMGYTISAFLSDSTIVALEDSYGNEFFHYNILELLSNKDNYSAEIKQEALILSMKTICAILSHFLK